MQCIETTLTHPTLTVQKYLGASFRERVYYHLGLWGPPVKFTVHHSNIVNLVRGIVTRVLYCKDQLGNMVLTPRPREGLYKSRLCTFLNLLKRHLPSTIRISRMDFVQLYTDRRKEVYRRAAESLEIHELEPKDARLKAFVKAEKICIQTKCDPDPRVIQPRDARYNVELGRYLKPIEKDLYQAVARVFHEPTIFKGFNSADSGKLMLAKWDKYANPVAVGLDASRFDQCVSAQALEWEHSIYLSMFNNDPELQRLLAYQIHNKGVGYCRDGKVQYEVEGCRMSGDMNTALGNCIIMCALVFSFCEHKSIPKFSLANNGDDCVVIFESKYLAQFSSGLAEWFSEMGFNMKVESPVYVFEEIEFCQTHPVRTPTGPIMVRNFPNSLAKDCISIKPLDSKIAWAKWINAIGECGLSLSGGIPILQDFYLGCMRAASDSYPKQKLRLKGLDPSQETGLVYFSHGMSRKAAGIECSTRYSFYLAFGVTPDEQIALEKYYQHHTPKYNVVYTDHPSNLLGWCM